MDMTGEHAIPASREQVWEALNDPDILRRCIPGCQMVEKTSPTEMTASAVARVGPVKATFKGVVTLSDLDPPNGYTISGQGKGGAAGFAKGSAAVRLTQRDGLTVLSYTVKASVGGKLAQVGGRLIDSAAKKMADDFFAALSATLTEETGAEETGAAPRPAEPAKRGLSPLVWASALIALAALSLWFYAR
jgi:carbon monoxide dehydrogenase subunit G